MKRVEPYHKQPSKPQTLAEALAADELRHQRMKEFMEYYELKTVFQRMENNYK